VLEIPAPDSDHAPDSKNFGGSRFDCVNQLIASQAMESMRLGNLEGRDRDKIRKISVYALEGLKPQDEAEGMLMAQMIGCHNASMECFRRAMLPEQTFDGRDMNLKHANRLTRAYAALLEALNKHRGKGQQKVTVEHVHVHEGGQAIVGNVDTGGDRGKPSERPHAKSIAHAPEPEMRSAVEADREPVPSPCDA